MSATVSRWVLAGEAAAAIMGHDKAEADPLAWWCATELIMGVGAANLAKVRKNRAKDINEPAAGPDKRKGK
jgi:hypothetical protein